MKSAGVNHYVRYYDQVFQYILKEKIEKWNKNPAHADTKGTTTNDVQNYILSDSRPPSANWVGLSYGTKINFSTGKVPWLNFERYFTTYSMG